MNNEKLLKIIDNKIEETGLYLERTFHKNRAYTDYDFVNGQNAAYKEIKKLLQEGA